MSCKCFTILYASECDTHNACDLFQSEFHLSVSHIRIHRPHSRYHHHHRYRFCEHHNCGPEVTVLEPKSKARMIKISFCNVWQSGVHHLYVDQSCLNLFLRWGNSHTKVWRLTGCFRTNATPILRCQLSRFTCSIGRIRSILLWFQWLDAMGRH